ncbi:glycoside hydrolase family 5 protein [Fimbriimonas ginsengisoli]|uniref:Glycoside hydrolase family 5 n=1 Tax=Fimbriimonas ginsengisoli Gsoil 348 TaxID=661478 RepID=A0A068NRU7_FIMGI|nr:cellulase family glycosylhydrolase [Fimbriimonas ginsengisoli]AIE86156.1 glycoside hydrolase family 5 [Fimbriimonas ginsengisoli Gsoil 348]
MFYGFNFLWMYTWSPDRPPLPADEKALDFLVHNGFNFVRIPTDYRQWTHDFDYFNLDEPVFEHLDGYLEALRSRGLHMSLNVHRAPGYCINRNDLERHNLWKDEIAQDAFVHLWETFARRYKGVPSSQLSFDLLNEPPNEGEYGFTRDIHQRVMRRTVGAIRAIDPDREIVLDGIGGGHYAMPELADLGVVHSGRGYQPMPVSHYHASWWGPGMSLPEPIYPGTPWEGKIWDKETLRELFETWRDVERMGVRIHMGEFGCYNQTPNDVALRWFADLFSLWHEYSWGFSFWNFDGPFGIVDHGRPGARYEQIDGYNVDIDLFKLVMEARV